MDLERDPLQPQPAREPRIQRLPARPDPPPAQPLSPAARIPAITRRPRWTIGRIAAIALLLISGAIMIGGGDEKPAPPPAPPAAADIAESAPDEIVVDLKDDATDQQIAALGESIGVQLQFASIHSRAARLMVARIDPANRTRILAALRTNPLVEAAEPQLLFHYDQAPAPDPSGSASSGRFVPNDPEYHRQWHLSMIGMEEAWAKSKGAGATVAIIDSGVGGITTSGYVHGQDFVETNFVNGYDFGLGREITPDDVGHGTFCASTIAEATDNGRFGAGIAPEAKVMPLRADDGKGHPKLSAVVDALHYAADHGANVANLSFSIGTPSEILAKGMAYAYKKNVTLVCSAGNDGKEGVHYPGRYKECITVSALGPTGMVTDYSTWGKGIDIAAPGGDPKMGAGAEIWQETIHQEKGWFGPGPRVDGFFPMSGTSMAAPQVAGVAALLVSLGMTSPKEIRSHLRKTAREHSPSDAAHYGAGILDASHAVESVHRSNRENWVEIALAIAAGGLALLLGRNLRRPTDPMFFVHHLAAALALGLFFPAGVEKLAGFGSWWNLAGHSVALGVLFLMTPGLGRSGFWKAFALALGLILHLILDADSGRAPFEVIPQSRVLLWLYANIAVGLYFAASSYRGVRRSAAMKARA